MKNKVIGILILFLISCNEKPKEMFSLTGKTNGIENGTAVYLEYNLDQEFDQRILLDSTTVIDNAFQFSTKLPNTPLLSVIFTKDYKEAKKLWVENTTMVFDASKTSFKKAVVRGSKNQALYQVIKDSIANSNPSDWDSAIRYFVKKHSESIVSTRYLFDYSGTWGEELTSELFENMPEKNKNSEYGKAIKQFLSLTNAPKIGDPFVDFEMKDLNGKNLKLSDVKNKVVLLDFWASWCGACRKQNPSLLKTYNQYKDKGFEIYAVSLDQNKKRWNKAIEEDSLPWMHVSDLKGRQNKAKMIYGIGAVPDNYLIDKDGIVIARDVKPEELDEKLKGLLN